jgi:hypothetical protein
MKKKIISSVLVTTASCLLSAAVLAYPVANNATFDCPAANGLSNFGSYLAGFGSESIAGVTNTIYFQSIQSLPAGIPDSLANYSNSATSYNMATGYVTCSFTSSNSAESNFDISYYVTNGKGGVIQSQANNTISIAFPVGFHS